MKIDGDGTWLALNAATVDIEGLTIRNSPRGIDFTDGDLTLTNLRLHDNTVAGSGGAIRFDGGGKLTLEDCTLEANSSTGDGGAISIIAGDLTLFDSTITGCTTSGYGGAISSFSGDVSLDNTDPLADARGS